MEDPEEDSAANVDTGEPGHERGQRHDYQRRIDVWTSWPAGIYRGHCVYGLEARCSGSYESCKS